MPANAKQSPAAGQKLHPHPKTSGKVIAHTRRKHRKHRRSSRMRKAAVGKHMPINNRVPPTPSACTIAQRSAMWQTAFASAVRWQAEYRTEYWKQLAGRRQLENQQLRQRLQALEGVRDIAGCGDDDETDEDDSADGDELNKAGVNEEIPTVSDEYLKFMEVSLRHQMQLKRDREEHGSV